MGNITVRASDELIEEIDREADERDISRAELVRECLRTRHETGPEVEELQQQLHECQMIAQALAHQHDRTHDALRREQDRVDQLLDLTRDQQSAIESAEQRASAGALTRLRRWFSRSSENDDGP